MRPARLKANPYTTRASGEVPSGVPASEAPVVTGEITVVHATEQVPTPVADNASTPSVEEAPTPAIGTPTSTTEEAAMTWGIGITQELGVTQEQADEAIASLVRVRRIVSATAAICLHSHSLPNAEASGSGSSSAPDPDQSPETPSSLADPLESTVASEVGDGKKRKQPLRQASSNSRAKYNNQRTSVSNKRAKTTSATKAATGHAKRGTSSLATRGGKSKVGRASRQRKVCAAVVKATARSSTPGASTPKCASESKMQALLEKTSAEQSVLPSSPAADGPDTRSVSRNSSSAGNDNIRQHMIEHSLHEQQNQQPASRREYWASHYSDSRSSAHDRHNMTLEESEGMAAAALGRLGDSSRGQEAAHRTQQGQDGRSASQTEQHHHQGQPYVGPRRFGYYENQASFEHMRALGRDADLSLRSAYLFGYADGLDTARGVVRHQQKPYEQQYGQPHEQQHYRQPREQQYGQTHQWPHEQQYYGQPHEQHRERLHEHRYGYPHDRRYGHPQMHQLGQRHGHNNGQPREHQQEQQQARYTLPRISGPSAAAWRPNPQADSIPESKTREWRELPPISTMHFAGRPQMEESAHSGQSDNNQVVGQTRSNRDGEEYSASRPTSRSRLQPRLTMGNPRLRSLFPNMSVTPVRPFESMVSPVQTLEPGASEQSVPTPALPTPALPTPAAAASTVDPANETLDDSATTQAPVQAEKGD